MNRLPAIVLAAAAVSFTSLTAEAAGEENTALPKPHATVIAPGTSADQAARVSLVARRYAAFWATGKAAFAEAALADTFNDQTLPEGRPQGREGPLQASAQFRKAVPDLTAEVEELFVAGDRAVVRLRFTGHFTGYFGETKGSGQLISFRAIDMYRVRDGRITDNWHLEDNLTLLKQMQLVK